MNVRDWIKFLEGPYDAKLLAIAQLPEPLRQYLGSPSRNVHLRRDYALKALKKHGVPPEHFHLIFEAIDGGIAVPDKPRHLTFFLFDQHLTERWFQVSVKCCEEDQVNVVATFHRQKAPEVMRRMRKTPPIWPKK
jgi:hypothetical protein